MPPESQSRWRSILVTVAGTTIVVAILAYVLSGRRDEFVTALNSAPLGILALAALLQIVALATRTEAWYECVQAAGATMPRRHLFRASSLGNLGSLLSAQLGAAARIAALRRTAPELCPRIPALIAAEVPIVTLEATLGVLTCWTLVGPLGLPWWSPLIAFAVMGAVLLALTKLAGREAPVGGFVSGLAVFKSLKGRNRVLGWVMIAVFAQISRNWLILNALGVDASIFDSIAVLLAQITFGQLPIGPSVGAAAVVAILGSDGVAVAAAAGVLLTATGTVGALLFASWGTVDFFRRHSNPPVAIEESSG